MNPLSIYEEILNMSLFGMFLREHLKTTPKAEFLKAFLLTHFSPIFYFY